MKTFKTISFNPSTSICRKELQKFKELLSNNDELQERRDLLSLFKENKHLIALLGTIHPEITNTNRIAYEFDIDDYVCDFVVGDSNRCAYLFVEFENAKKDSLFTEGQRSVSEWGRRFEHGFSQIIDWAYKLSDIGGSDTFEAKFECKTI